MEQQRSGLQSLFLTVFFCGLVLLCALSALLIRQYRMINRAAGTEMAAVEEETVEPTRTESAMQEITAESTATPTADTVDTTETAVQLPGMETLEILESVEVPENNPLDLAVRFSGVSDPRVQLSEPAVAVSNGAEDNFWILEVDENFYRQITAELVYQTPHLYFWVEQGLEYDPEDVVQLADVFENSIYPTNRTYFGSEWTPGVDNDEHLVIVYAQGLGSAAGYFSGSDSLTPEVRAYSNVAEMFYLSADYTDLKSSFTYGVLAHEFQHMIHWNHDRNETSWLNEGFSELAVDLNGYDIGGFDYYFAFDPDLQLNFWPGNDQGNSSPHYGASYLFARYLLSQFGAQSIKDIVDNPRNGLVSLDEALAPKMNAYDANWTQDIRPGDQVFQNWVIANSLQNNHQENGIYGYGEDVSLPSFYSSEEWTCDDTGWLERTVNQYGTDYIQVTCDGNFTIELEGDPVTSLLPVEPHSGDYYFWSNNGDESHMSLSREFDFSQVNAPITLDYWTWYDIETDYDYLYLTASTDGQNWEILQPASCTRENPTGANYGCGYNAQSNGWMKEEADLSGFAGQKVTLQFEYLTDAAVNGEGFLIDDISVEALDYFTDFETNAGGWEAKGFVRISNSIPQAYAAAVIQPDFNATVDKWISPVGLKQDVEIENQGSSRRVTIAISGLTRHTHSPAVYRIKITRLD